MEALIHHTHLPLAFSFKDDGRVAYGYLHQDGKVVGDVWLYNRGEAPETPEWRDKAALPFRNPAGYTKSPGLFLLPKSESEIGAGWVTRDGSPGVVVLLNGLLIGELYVGDKPGRSLMAAKDGPLARCMGVEPSWRRVPTAMDLPLEMLNAYEKGFIANVREHGWFGTSVLGDDEGPGFTYTTGFWLAFGAPEVIVMSLPSDTAHNIMWDIYRALEAGKRFPVRAPVAELLSGFNAAFLPVAKKNYQIYPLSSRWFYGDDFPCVQLVWPDTKSVFPWQIDFDPQFAKDQIDLTDGDWAGGFLH